MDLALQLSVERTYKPFKCWVSILVLMDLALQHILDEERRKRDEVSILVLMDLALQRENGNKRNPSASRVSILVLMDLALQPREKTH